VTIAPGTRLALRRNAAPITISFDAASGIARLRELLEATFGARADALKADRALLALERLSFVDGGAGSGPEVAAAQRAFRNEIERLRIEPEMHALRQIRALQACLEADVGGIPPELEAELRRLLDRYGGSNAKALAAYNAGEDAVAKWERRYGPRPDDEFTELISYRETRDYVKLVLQNLQVYRQLYAASPFATSPGSPPNAPLDMVTTTSPGALVATR
jgi:hypothetical protein